MSSEAWRRSRSERHLQTAAERRSGEGHKPTTFAESARRRRAERVENGDKRASKGASQVKSSSSGTTPEQEDVLEGMLNDYVAVADILEQSVAEANQARNGLTILLILLTVLYLFISKQIKAAYSDKPQVADYLHASRFGTIPAIIEEGVGVAFATSAFCNLLLFFVEIHPGKKIQSLMAVYVAGISALTAYNHCNAAAPVLIGVFGQLCNPMRYMMWAFTTPVMVMMVYFFSDFERSYGLMAAAADLGMVMFGAFAELVPNRFVAYTCYAAAYALFFVTMNALLRMFSSALENNQHRSVRVLKTARAFSIVCWTAFPLILLIREIFPDLMDFGTYEMLNTIAHYFSKIVFTNLLVHDFCLTVTERNALAMRKNQTNTNKQVVEKLESLVQAQDYVLKTSASTLRAPVRCIVATTKDLIANCSGDMTDATILQLSTVVTNSQRLLHLVENIMDSSVMKGNQQIQLQLAPIAIWPIVESTVRLFSTMAMAGVSINIDVPRSLPPIHADEDRVAQILSNLLTNAFKFTIHGSVSVSACVKGDYLDVAVKDTGPGVSKNAIRNVFQPLSSDREAGTGMGMGLSLVHDLVKAHTGNVNMQSQLGQGSTFSFTLPLAKAGDRARNIHGVPDESDVDLRDLRVVRKSLEQMAFSHLQQQQGREMLAHKMKHADIQSNLCKTSGDPVPRGMSAPQSRGALLPVPLPATGSMESGSSRLAVHPDNTLVMETISQVVKTTLVTQFASLVPESALAGRGGIPSEETEMLKRMLVKQQETIDILAKMTEMKLFEMKTELLANTSVSNQDTSSKLQSLSSSLSTDLKIIKEQMVEAMHSIKTEITTAALDSPTPSRTPSFSSVISPSAAKVMSQPRQPTPIQLHSSNSSGGGPIHMGAASQQIIAAHPPKTPSWEFMFDPTQTYTLEKFLEAIGLQRFLMTFVDQEVDLATLLTLSEPQLKSLGVESLGARLRLIQAFEAFDNSHQVLC